MVYTYYAYRTYKSGNIDVETDGQYLEASNGFQAMKKAFPHAQFTARKSYGWIAYALVVGHSYVVHRVKNGFVDA